MIKRIEKETETAPNQAKWKVPLPRKNLSDQAYEAIRDALMNGQLVPGEKLILRPLSEQFSISATPMREALLKLVASDVLEFDHRGTVQVPMFETVQHVEILKVRAMLEGYALEDLCEHATDKEIDELAAVQDDLDASQKERNFEESIRLNASFHLKLCKLSNLSVVPDFVENLWIRIGPSLSQLYDRKLPRLEKHPHIDILQALRRRSPDEAKQALFRDIRIGASIIGIDPSYFDTTSKDQSDLL